jgi:peptidoglycan/LPS O-acetylase OafA/YrhL
MNPGHYRSDIDGLRAIAVVSVIIFHLKSSLLPGGFVGVDIFFAISGYLITKNIAEEMGSGKFSIVEFYRRRIKRIAPVMLTVIASVLSIGYLVLLPEELVALAKSAFWSVGSLANVYFWHEVDTEYFATASSQLPLLHLWSLGVEEQFYLLWPLLLMLIWRVAPTGTKGLSALNISLVLGILAVPLSIGLAMHLYSEASRFVYYMLPTRAGELMMGAAAALWAVNRPKFEGTLARSRFMACTGLALIGLSFVFITEEQPFPGWRAVPPTAGVVLLLLAGRSPGKIRALCFLSLAPMVWIGKLSYSLYLWHWPVLAIWRYTYGEPDALASLGLLILMVLLAQASFTMVEQPARYSRSSALRVFLLQLAVPGACLVLVTLTLVFGDRWGIPTHSAGYLQQLNERRMDLRPAYQLSWVCQRQLLQVKDLSDRNCVLGPPSDQPPKVLLWGDSNAAHYIPMLEVLAREEGVSFRNFAIGACPPVLGDPAPFVALGRYSDCAASLKLAWSALSGYQVVIFSALWLSYDQRGAEFFPRLEVGLRALTERGQRVILLSQTTLLKDYDGRCYLKTLKLQQLQCAYRPQQIADEVVGVNSKLQALAARMPGVEYFDTNAYLCPQGQCAVTDAQGVPNYFDGSHLNVRASRSLGEYIFALTGTPTFLKQSSH